MEKANRRVSVMPSKIRCLMRCVVFLLVSGLLFGSQSIGSERLSAQGLSWSKPVLLSTNTDVASSWFPTIVVDDQDNSHVYYDATRNKRDCVMYTTWDEGRWSQPVDIVSPAQGGYVTRPRAALDRYGNLQLLFRARTDVRHTWSPLDTAIRPQSWAPAQLFSSGAAYYSDVAVDIYGTIHVVWNQTVAPFPDEMSWICPGCMDIYYRHSSDGGRTWSAPVNLSDSPGGSNRPQINVDGRGTVYVVWEEATDYTGQGQPMGVAARCSRDGGVTWDPVYHVINRTPSSPPTTPEPRLGEQATSTPTPLAAQMEWFSPTVLLPDAGVPIQASIAVDVAGVSALMVWRTTQEEHPYLYYQLSQDAGATWSDPQEIPGFYARLFRDTYFDTYDMATDSLGHVHLLAVGRLPEPLASGLEPPRRLYELVFDGVAWGAPVLVSSREGFLPEWPQVAIALGNRLHVVWFERALEDLYRSESARYKVWYSSRSAQAPPATALPWFTPAPTPTATTPATPPATSVPTSTLVPLDSRSLGRSMYSEQTFVLHLLVAIAPVLLVAFVFLMGRQMRKR